MSSHRRRFESPSDPAAADEVVRWNRGERTILLGRSSDGLELRTLEDRPGRGVRSAVAEVLSRGVDRSHPLVRILQGLEGHPGVVVDATAGLGGDAAVAAGMDVRPVLACESNPIVAAVLEDGIRRAQASGLPGAERLSLRMGDAAETLARLARLETPPALVVLDPMFPPRRRASALPPKPMQRLRELADPLDADHVRRGLRSLLDSAFAARARRVVLKRPPEAAIPECTLGVPTFEIETRLLRWVVWERGDRSG